MDSSSENNPPSELTDFGQQRRTLVKSIIGAAVLAATGGATVKILSSDKQKTNSEIQPSPELDTSHELTIVPIPPEASFASNIGVETPIETPGLYHVPDGHIAFQRLSDGQSRMWFSAGSMSYAGEFDQANQPARITNRATAVTPEYNETEEGYNGYRALSGVVPRLTETGEELVGFYHDEMHDSATKKFPFNARIGISVSKDNGTTWENRGLVIRGNQPTSSVGEFGDRVIGAGQGCPIIQSVEGTDYVYVYYTDWAPDQPDSIHLSRCRLDSLEDTTAWEKFSQGNFVPSNVPENSSSVIDPKDDEVFNALPSISFNTALNKYVAVYETNKGFNMAVSDDGVTWSERYPIVSFPQPHSDRKKGDVWYSYPSLLSLESSSDMETTDECTLIYSKGVYEQEPHSMQMRNVVISPTLS